MECLIGITFKDFVLLAADTMAAHSIISIKQDHNKLYQLSDHLGMLVSGESGDTVQFAEYISKNIQLFKMRNGFELSPQAAANYTRKNLADSLRTRNHYMVNLLLAGYDEKDGPGLYYIDHLATMAKVPYAVHGYGGYFIYGLLDRYYRSDVEQKDAIEILRKCIAEIQKRLVLNLPSFKMWIIDANGIKDVDAPTPME
ncbi:PSMB2 [Cordylochernes scorpioides]|uniref:Proteasome subunit beta n=1 Tax=Cordylochernes scorpioides TaxID=51811 RepID=A0ABY6KG06_9ARAC|nr:PSMB2 [Cordylochernes scorpioides]UYV66718.1 PSMB2 [Cordylochernes scorpioides]